VHPPPGSNISGSEFNQELYSNESYIRKKIKEAMIQQASISTIQNENKKPTSHFDSIDAEFFSQSVPVAKTVGKFASQDFCRVPSADIRGSAHLPPKKSHKKGKK
jgi:hypothetical protein